MLEQSSPDSSGGNNVPPDDNLTSLYGTALQDEGIDLAALVQSADVDSRRRRCTPVPASWSDAHVGESFGETIRGRYLHCGALGGWLQWDGKRWRRDSSEAVLEEARMYVVQLCSDLLASDATPKVLSDALQYRNRHKIESIAVIARRLPGISANADEFDRHPDLLVAANGVVDMRTGHLCPHDPALRLTQCTGIAYEPDAAHADVDAVASVVDDDVRAWLQRLFGYAATGHTTEDVVPVLDGSGSNGKTTLLSAVSAALGDYANAVPARLLMKGAHDEHPALFADLRGRRLAYIEETAEGSGLRIEAMKMLSGGGEISARFMRRDWFTFTPTHQLVIATNHRPAVNSSEHATWRRLRLVPFPHRYGTAPEDRAIDLGLRDRLRRGIHQRKAMLAWIVNGAIAWNRQGLGDCPDISAATTAWRLSEDVIHRYAHDRLGFDPAFEVGVAALFEDYRNWCASEGRPSGSLKELGKRFEDHDLFNSNNLTSGRTRTGSRWFGVALRDAL